MAELKPDELRRLLAEPSDENTAEIRQRLAELYAADIVELLEEIEDEDRLQVFELLDTRSKAAVIHEAGVGETADLIEPMPTRKVASMFALLPLDELVDVLEDLPAADADALMALLKEPIRDRVRRMRAYPEDSAGRLMSGTVVRVQLSWTVDRTLAYLRTLDPETETFAHLYAVNARDQLVGLIRSKHLLTAQPDVLLADLVEPRLVSVTVTDDQEDVAQSMSKYNFSALPVVDGAGKLVGVVTHDDVLDVVEEEATEDIHRLGGSSPLDEPYLSASVATLAGKRIGWLLLLLLTASMTMYLMKLHEAQLQKVVALAFFVPLLLSIGGNAGSQTTSMVIRALAIGDVEHRDALRVLWQELRTGLVLGLTMGVVGGLLALVLSLYWHDIASIALVVSLAAFAIVVWATSVGALLPLGAARLGLDPTVVSGPLMSTLVDATGLLIYLTIAGALLPM